MRSPFVLHRSMKGRNSLRKSSLLAWSIRPSGESTRTSPYSLFVIFIKSSRQSVHRTSADRGPNADTSFRTGHSSLTKGPIERENEVCRFSNHENTGKLSKLPDNN